jgi:hypothetical protein
MPTPAAVCSGASAVLTARPHCLQPLASCQRCINVSAVSRTRSPAHSLRPRHTPPPYHLGLPCSGRRPGEMPGESPPFPAGGPRQGLPTSGSVPLALRSVGRRRAGRQRQQHSRHAARGGSGQRLAQVPRRAGGLQQSGGRRWRRGRGGGKRPGVGPPAATARAWLPAAGQPPHVRHLPDLLPHERDPHLGSR